MSNDESLYSTTDHKANWNRVYHSQVLEEVPGTLEVAHGEIKAKYRQGERQDMVPYAFVRIHGWSALGFPG